MLIGVIATTPDRLGESAAPGRLRNLAAMTDGAELIALVRRRGFAAGRVGVRELAP